MARVDLGEAEVAVNGATPLPRSFWRHWCGGVELKIWSGILERCRELLSHRCCILKLRHLEFRAESLNLRFLKILPIISILPTKCVWRFALQLLLALAHVNASNVLPCSAHSDGTGVWRLNVIGELVRYWYGDGYPKKMCELSKNSWGILCGNYCLPLPLRI